MNNELQRVRQFPWQLIIPGTLVFATLFFFHRALDPLVRNHSVDWIRYAIEELTGVLNWLPLLVFVGWLVLRYPLIHGGWRRHWWIHLLAAFACGFVHTTLMYLSRLALFAAIGRGVYDYGAMPGRYFMELPLQLIVFTVLVTVISFGELRRDVRAREARLAALEGELTRAQLESLQLQIQPHFLFNALNAISAVVYEDPAAADRMITRLSDFLRRVLRADRAQETTLAEELDLLELYVDVMRARMEHLLEYDVRVEDGLDEALIPQLLLQPLVENAIRYGVDPETGRVSIRVLAAKHGDGLTLTVANSGPAESGAESGLGIGLANLQGRLEKLYGSDAHLQMEPLPEGGMQVRIGMPLHTAPGVVAQ